MLSFTLLVLHYGSHVFAMENIEHVSLVGSSPGNSLILADYEQLSQILASFTAEAPHSLSTDPQALRPIESLFPTIPPRRKQPYTAVDFKDADEACQEIYKVSADYIESTEASKTDRWGSHSPTRIRFGCRRTPIAGSDPLDPLYWKNLVQKWWVMKCEGIYRPEIFEETDAFGDINLRERAYSLRKKQSERVRYLSNKRDARKTLKDSRTQTRLQNLPRILLLLIKLGIVLLGPIRSAQTLQDRAVVRNRKFNPS